MRASSISSEQMQPWARLNNVQLNDVTISQNIVTNDGIEKGGGLLATTSHGSEAVLLSVPQDLVLSKEAVLQCAKFDKDLRSLIDGMQSFVETPRKAIVLFLLYQMTMTSLDTAEQILGVQSPFTTYFRALPKEIPLPTFLSSEERELLAGTSLSEALESKLLSLEREFDELKEKTQGIKWCQKFWWDETTGKLTFHDWLLADALYRSRALELPHGVGDAMVPVLDMANHSADNRYNARFEVDGEGKVLLLVREGKSITEAEEITITYGCGGASEMIFSYGFLDANAQSAREMFLSLRAPDDDPLRLPKLHFAKEAPGVRIYLNADGLVTWESNFVWWTVVNEEDGLDFEILQTTSGGRELQAMWQGESLDPEKLKSILLDDARKEIFMLRAVVTIQERIEQQGEDLSRSQVAFDDYTSQAPQDKRSLYETLKRLRELELDLLTASYQALEHEKQELLSSRTVTEYLAAQSHGQQEDFS